jgi:hypothetical protein
VRDDLLERPVFVIGMPRSGTTVLFEAIARHPDLGWLSNYCRMYPRAPWLNVVRRILDNRVIHLHGHKRQYGSAPPYNPWLPQPDEAYEFWDAYSGAPFSRDGLHDRTCDLSARDALRSAAARVVAWQGRQRFAAKLTGPPRIRFLHSVFPDAAFVHLIRDGRAVVHSLLQVPFWRKAGGLERPFWSGVVQAADLETWERSGRHPGVLAGLQWKRVIELARAEAARAPGASYVEVRYEDFTSRPHETVRDVLAGCGLSDLEAVHRAIDVGPALQDMNAKFRQALSAESLELVTASMRPVLEHLGYA